MSESFEQVLSESEIELYHKVQQVFESFKTPYGNETAVELTRIYFDTLSKWEQEYGDEEEAEYEDDDSEIAAEDLNA